MEDDAYKCEECERCFVNRYNFWRHMNEFHQDEGFESEIDVELSEEEVDASNALDNGSDSKEEVDVDMIQKIVLTYRENSELESDTQSDSFDSKPDDEEQHCSNNV